MLPPFKVRLARTDPRHSNDVALEWYVQEKQGVKVLSASGLCCQGYRDVVCDKGAFIITIDDDNSEPTQSTSYNYHAPKITQCSSGYRDDPLGGYTWTNHSLSVASEFPKELPRPDSPTVNLYDQPRIVRKHRIETAPPSNTAHEDFTDDGYWLLSDSPIQDIELGRSDRRKARSSSTNRPKGSAAKFRGHGDQHRVRMPAAPYDNVGPILDHQDQRLAHAQDRSEPSVVKPSENYLHQNKDDQYYQSQEIALDDAAESHTAINGLSHRAGNFQNLDSLLENEIFGCEASRSRNPIPCQYPLQSSQSIFEDTICAPRLSAELVHGRLRNMVKDGPEVLTLQNQYVAHHPALHFPAVVPNVCAGRPDDLNFPGHDTGGLGWPSPKNNRKPSRLRSMRSRISNRLWPLRGE